MEILSQAVCGDIHPAQEDQGPRLAQTKKQGNPSKIIKQKGTGGMAQVGRALC
jgi:hypothetical protein